MEITKDVKARDFVYNIQKINEDTFLTGEGYGDIECVSKKDLTCLSYLKIYGIYEFH